MSELCTIAYQGEAHDYAAATLRDLCERQLTVDVYVNENDGAPITATPLAVKTNSEGFYVIDLGVWPDGSTEWAAGMEVRTLDIYTEIDRLEVV